MNYAETVDYLYTRLPMFQKIGSSALKKDLNNTLFLTKFLGEPQKRFKSIHIAGTNGKGSSAHTLAAILQSAGYKTGLYTSPHLKSFTERIKINGKEISEDKVISFVKKIKPAIESVHPSFFEVTVAMAFDIFADEDIDIAVIETGLGGRLDSTNVIDPLLSLITNIGFDHQAILGESLEEIAAEKAGIIKKNTPVIIGEYQNEVAHVFKNKAREQNAALYFAATEFTIDQTGNNDHYNVVDVYLNDQSYLYDLSISLTGDYQLKNIPGILKSIQLLNKNGYTISDEAIRDGFQNVGTLTGLKGRWQVLGKDPLVVCDTGHNESGMAYIVQQFRKLTFTKLHIVLGVANDKKLDGIFKILPKDAFYYFCQAQIPRAMEAGLLAQQASKFGLVGKVIPDINDAIKEAKLKATATDMIFIGGSSFVVAEIEDL